ncbi:hypothetical protein [Massilia sp. DWR3-1-1]|uniref:hypothetical protein n=1 Tax=Massilia sp. DWR3-1-1 TaxID=2804559 RepID=UPI003CF5FE47
MNEDPPRAGLASIADVEALADQLSASADALHKRLMKEITSHQGPFSDDEQAVVRALNDDEQLLRQRANSLYADAAAAVVPALGVPQQLIIELTAAAVEKIRKIGKLGEVIGLIGGLLSLAGSAGTGNLAGVVAALGQVRLHAAGVAAHQPPAPPATP